MDHSEDLSLPVPTLVQDERQRMWRKCTQEAVALAMQGRWEEAVTVNQRLLAMVPGDVETWNRLGKALLEVGDRAGAQGAFEHSLAISPNNVIARKNLERLARFKAAPPASGKGRQVASGFFIEESSKTARVTLSVAPEVAASVLAAAGEPVDLKRRGQGLAVYDVRDHFIGPLPPALGSRLLRLMEGGNRYEGAVFNVGQGQVTVLFREIYQHPSLRQVHSFSGTQRPSQVWGVSPHRRPGKEGADVLDRWLPAAWDNATLHYPNEAREQPDALAMDIEGD